MQRGMLPPGPMSPRRRRDAEPKPIPAPLLLPTPAPSPRYGGALSDKLSARGSNGHGATPRFPGQHQAASAKPQMPSITLPRMPAAVLAVDARLSARTAMSDLNQQPVSPPLEMDEIVSRSKSRDREKKLSPVTTQSLLAELSQPKSPRQTKPYLMRDTKQQQSELWNQFQLQMHEKDSSPEPSPPPSKPNSKDKKSPRKRPGGGAAAAAREKEMALYESSHSKWAIKVACVLHQQMKANQTRVRDIMGKFDTDGSGALDCVEFQAALQELGIADQLKIPQEEFETVMNEVFQSFDEDDSGIIDFKEMNKMLRAGKFVDIDLDQALEPGQGIDAGNVEKESKLQAEFDRLERFEEMDADGSGVLSMFELQSFLTAEGHDVKFVEQLMATLDADASGSVDKDEWRAGCSLLRGSTLLTAMTTPIEPPSKDIFVDLVVPRNIWAGGASEHINHDRRNQTIVPKEDTVLGKKNKGCTVSDPALRGILTAQLRSFIVHIQRRCEKEIWVNSKGRKTTAREVTMYDAVAYVIKPATRERKCSYVELVSNKEQKPDWFVSYSWAESVVDLFSCIEQMGRDRNLCLSGTSYWASGFALSAWKLGNEIKSAGVSQSPFARAMELCSGTLCVVGTTAGSAKPRSWICFEIGYSIELGRTRSYFFDLYTPKKHKLLGELVHEPKKPARFLPGTHTWDKNVLVNQVSAIRDCVGLIDGVCNDD